jgi:hypothetical protein
LYEYEFSSLTLEEMHRIRLSEDRGMRNIFWPKWNKITGDMTNCIMKSFIIRIPHQIEERSTYVVLMGKPEGKIYLEDLGVDGR